MRITLFAAAIAVMLPLSVAQAGNPPVGAWCARFADGSGDDCSLPTRAACEYTIRGVGGTCSQNPLYFLSPRDPRRTHPYKWRWY